MEKAYKKDCVRTKFAHSPLNGRSPLLVMIISPG